MSTDTVNDAPQNIASTPNTRECIRKAVAYTRATKFLDTKLSAHGLGFTDFMLMYQLANAPDGKLSRTDLADAVGLTPSAVTRALLPLEKLGWVGRESNPRDARVGYACLTPEGTALFSDAAVTAEVACTEALSTLRASARNR